MRRKWFAPIVAGASAALVAGLLPAVAAPAQAEAAPVESTTSQAAEFTPASVSGLDKSGNNLPSTDYAIPSGAIYMAPWGDDRHAGTQVDQPVRTLNTAINTVPEGGTIVLRGGTYRDAYTTGGTRDEPRINQKALTLQAYPNEQPWFDGSDVVPASDFSYTGNSWATEWSTPTFCDGRYYERAPLDQNPDNNGPCAHIDNAVVGEGDTLPSDPQQAFVDGVEQTQVASRGSVKPGTFYYDWHARKLHLGTDPNGRTVELTARSKAFIFGAPEGATTRWSIKGIGVKRYASTSMGGLGAGAVYIGGGVSEFENTVFTQNASGAISFSTPQSGSKVSRSVFTQNGDTPIGATGEAQKSRVSNFTVENSVFNHNVWSGNGLYCTISCGQSAVKLVYMDGFRLSGNLVEDMGGSASGLWCDGLCRNGEYSKNTIRDIGGIGIFHEVSDTGLIAGNVVDGAKAGIQVTSANTKVYNNTVLNIQEDVPIRVYDDSRRHGHNGEMKVGPDTRNVHVRNNLIGGSRNMAYAVNPDATEEVEGNTMPAEYFTAFDDNTVVSSQDDGLFMAWRRDLRSDPQYYRVNDRTRFSDEYGWEKRSVWRQAGVESIVPGAAEGDYRVSDNELTRSANRPPLPQDVADALGVEPDALPLAGAPVE